MSVSLGHATLTILIDLPQAIAVIVFYPDGMLGTTCLNALLGKKTLLIAGRGGSDVAGPL